MKRRVALLSSCCPPLPGTPVTGGGLRTAQLVDALRDAGHTVILAVEAAALPPDAPADLRHWAFEAGEEIALVRKARVSAVIVEQWALAARLAGLGKPLAVDLHGSLLLENVYRRGETELVLDAGAKLDGLRAADLLLAPAAAQLHHFASWATLAGFDPRELPLRLLPLAAAPAPARTRPEGLHLIYGGARWPWIDSLRALTEAAEAVQDRGTLDVYTYEPPRHGLAVAEDQGTWPAVDEVLRGRAGVTLHAGVGHGEYRAALERATVALDLWEPNPERLLAATTRTIEFLAAGLPVVTVAGAAWAEELVEFGAGWTVPAGDDAALGSLVQELAADPDRVAAASAGALRLLRERHDPQRAAAALCSWVAAPSHPPRAPRSLVEALVDVHRAHIAEVLASKERAHADEHDRLVAAHDAQVAKLRERHGAEVVALTAAHRTEQGEREAAHQDRMDAQAAERRREAREREQQDREERAAEREQHRRELAALEARTEQDRASAEAERERLVAAQAAEVSRLRDEHVGQTAALVAAHRAEVLTLRDEFAARAEAAEQAWRIRADEAEQAARTRAERADQEFRQTLSAAIAEADRRAAQAAAERQTEVERLVDEKRSELEAGAARHREELQAAVAEWQERVRVLDERMRSDRHQAREARVRQEVELRAEIARREARLAQSERVVAGKDERIAWLEARLAQSERVVAGKDERIAWLEARQVPGMQRLRSLGSRLDADLLLPGRVGPALRLARLFAEHAMDRRAHGPGPGEGE